MALFRLAYARVSSQDQNIELQLSQFEALGYDELFQEKISGRKRDRPEFLKMCDRALELRKQKHDVHIFVIEWSRWARDTAFALDTLKKLEDAGVLVVETTTKQPLTLQTPDGFISTSMKSMMAQYYSVELSGRQKRAYAARKAKKRATSNRPIWGYKPSEDKSHWVPSEDWEIARKSIEKFMQGGSINGICRWLGEQGASKSRHGFLAWLKHHSLRGHVLHNGEMIYNTHQPMITEAEWGLVRQRIEQNKQLRGANSGRIYAVPVSLCRCDRCGRVLQSKSGAFGRYFYCYYACSLRDGSCDAPRSYLRDTWVEAAIQEAIRDQAESVVTKTTPVGKLANPQLLAKEEDLTRLRGLTHIPGVTDSISLLEQEIEAIKTNAKVDGLENSAKVALIQELAQLTPEDWQVLSVQDRRDLYTGLVKHVLLLGNEIQQVELL